MKNCLMAVAVFSVVWGVYADTVVFNGLVNDSPSVVKNAEAREAKRQDSTWTAENIQKNPYLFLQDQIAQCDKLKSKLEAQNITLVRMEKEAVRKAEEADGLTARYTKFLKDAKSAYKAAPATKRFPVMIGDYEVDEEEFNQLCADAMDRIEMAKKDKKQGAIVSRKVAARKGLLKSKKRELESLRVKLTRQAEQVKMNTALAEIDDLKTTMDTIKDMRLELESDPSKMSLDDLTATDPNAKRNARVNSFLNDDE